MIIKVGDKTIGKIEDGVFTKKVSGSKHMLHSPPAWAVDSNVWDNQVKNNCQYIVIFDRETSMRYWSTVQNFERFRGSLDRGFEPQYYLVLSRWSKTKPVEQGSLI